jgi:hypothetical protein
MPISRKTCYSTLILSGVLSLSFVAGASARVPQKESERTVKSAKTPVRKTGIVFPRLVGYPNPRVQAKVNREIDSITHDFGCDEHSRRSSYTVKSNVSYAKRDIFSIYASAAYYCGGPYPTNDSNLSATFDLRTGKRVTFEELFADYETNKREILKTIFAAQVANSEKLQAAGKTSEDDCNGNPEFFSLDNLESSTFAFNLSSDGLHVQPDWPHAIEACAIIANVPYATISKYASKNGILERAAR